MIKNKIKKQEEEIKKLIHDKKKIEDRLTNLVAENARLKNHITLEENISKDKNNRTPNEWIELFNEHIPQITRNIYRATYEWDGPRHPLWRMVYKIKPYTGPMTSVYKEMLEIDREEFVKWCNECKERFIANAIKERVDDKQIAHLRSFTFT